MNKLPMNFNWRAARGNAGLSMQMPILSEVQGQRELIESILSHIELQVLKSRDLDNWNNCGKDPYKFVVETFIKPILLPYINMHKVDGNGIMYIAMKLKNIDQSYYPLNESNTDGLTSLAVVSNDTVYIDKNVLIKAIADMCM